MRCESIFSHAHGISEDILFNWYSDKTMTWKIVKLRRFCFESFFLRISISLCSRWTMRSSTSDVTESAVDVVDRFLMTLATRMKIVLSIILNKTKNRIAYCSRCLQRRWACWQSSTQSCHTNQDRRPVWVHHRYECARVEFRRDVVQYRRPSPWSLTSFHSLYETKFSFMFCFECETYFVVWLRV